MHGYIKLSEVLAVTGLLPFLTSILPAACSFAEATTQRLFGRSFALACASRYKAWMDHHKEPWIPVFHELSSQVDLPQAAVSTPSAPTPSTSSHENVSLIPVGIVNASHEQGVGVSSSHSPSAAHADAGVVRRGSSMRIEDSPARGGHPPS